MLSENSVLSDNVFLTISYLVKVGISNQTVLCHRSLSSSWEFFSLFHSLSPTDHFFPPLRSVVEK